MNDHLRVAQQPQSPGLVEDMLAEGVAEKPQRFARQWSVFVGWHSTEKLWQDIYTRTVSALVAALVIYLVAALSGVVPRRPLAVIGLSVFAAWIVKVFATRYYNRASPEVRRRLQTLRVLVPTCLVASLLLAAFLVQLVGALQASLNIYLLLR